MKTAELTGAALDWAVCKAAGMIDAYPRYKDGAKFLKLHGSGIAKYLHPSTDWSQGGPIIEQKIFKVFRNVSGNWTAQIRHLQDDGTLSGQIIWYNGTGPTALVAAMRCFVASRLGDEVEIPEELS